MKYSEYASVVLDLSIGKCLDYGIPDKFLGLVKTGVKVSVPVRGLLRTGYVLGVKPECEFAKISPIEAILSSVEAITPKTLELALWMAKYYGATLNQVFKAILPSTVRKSTKHKQQYAVMRTKTREELADLCKEIRNKSSQQAAVLDAMLQVKKTILLTELLELAGVSRAPVDALVKKGALAIDIVRIDRSPLIGEEYFPTKPKTLNPQQKEAADLVFESIEKNLFRTHLVHGITGSGKTEIYLQCIQKALDQGKGALMLVPEIALTAQMIEKFRSRFEGQIAILHHRLSPGERFDEWHRILRGEAKIAIGARSAVFSPVQNLGLIIVDEEHESSYKQNEEAPCYHARDVAVMRAKMSSCPVILGSATPSLESYHNALQGKYLLSELSVRADQATLPKITIIDMTQDYERSQGSHLFSESLLNAIKEKHEKGEQTILFLNRRGFHTSLICQGCQQVVKCSQCDLALTFHKGDNTLSCHLCGFTLSPPRTSCAKCHASTLKFKGAGTEQVQKALHAIFPEIRSIRIDADTTRHKGSHQQLIRSFGAGKADVLIGTQMIAKGLHFPEVTLVGILNSDNALNIPDFRASETVFQLITQVAGRAGRGVHKGEVMIQTRMKDHATIQLAKEQDYVAFFKHEMESRKLFEVPPFSHFIKIQFSGPHENRVRDIAEGFQKELVARLPAQCELMPVIPSGHAKIKDQFRFQFLIKGKNVYPIVEQIETVKQLIRLPHGIRILVDVDPTSTF